MALPFGQLPSSPGSLNKNEWSGLGLAMVYASAWQDEPFLSTSTVFANCANRTIEA